MCVLTVTMHTPCAIRERNGTTTDVAVVATTFVCEKSEAPQKQRTITRT